MCARRTSWRVGRPVLSSLALLACAGMELATARSAEATITATGRTIAVTAGQQFNKRVAAFVSDRAGAQRQDFDSLIGWGDGNFSLGVIRNAGQGRFAVQGRHTYSLCGTFSISVEIVDTVNSDQALTSGQALVTGVTGQAPVITAPVSVVVGATGETASVPNNAGSTYTWLASDRNGDDLGSLITGGQGTSQITFNAAPPGTTMFFEVVETPPSACAVPPGSRRVQVDFLDVPPSHIFHDFVVNLAGNGITLGCGGGNYCPGTSTLRDQMAVFLLRSKEGTAYTPPAAVGAFDDVPMTNPFASWIEELFRRGITGGCSVSPPLYCPRNPTLRKQMAVFLLKTSLGSSYVPPTANGVFGDVPANDPFASWIEDIYVRGITSGCSTNPLLFCPDNPVTRGQMGVFLVRTFGLVFP